MMIKLRDSYKEVLLRIQEDFKEAYPEMEVPTYPQIVEAFLATYLDQVKVPKKVIRKKL